MNQKYLASTIATIITVALGLITFWLGGFGALKYAWPAILAMGVYVLAVTRGLVQARSIGQQSLTMGSTEVKVGVFLLIAVIILAIWGSASGGDSDPKPNGSELTVQKPPFSKDGIEGVILQYALPLQWERIPLSQTWRVDITNEDIKEPVFLYQNYALMEDGEFWFKFPAYQRNLQVMVGLNPLMSDDSYYHYRSSGGNGPMFETAALFGVAEANPALLRIYGPDRIRPKSPFSIVLGGKLPSHKEVVRVALTQTLDPAATRACTKIPTGYYCRLYVRYATEGGINFSQDIMDRPAVIDPNGIERPLFPGIYLEGITSGRKSMIPMGGRRTSHHNAYTDESETEINSLDSRWLKGEDVIVHVITPAADQLVRAEVIIRLEPLDVPN